MSTRLHKYTVAMEEDSRGARHYVTPLGLLPSVTTIIKGPARWGRPAGSVYVAGARLRGRELHEEVEAFLLDPRSPTCSAFFPSLRPFLSRIRDVWLVEGHLWHPDGFAGAVDCVAEVDGVLSVIDWKTSDVPRSARAVDEAHMQVAAYRAAAQYLYGIEIPRGFVVVALPDAAAQVFPTENFDGAYAYFSDRLNRHHAWHPRPAVGR